MGHQTAPSTHLRRMTDSHTVQGDELSVRNGVLCVAVAWVSPDSSPGLGTLRCFRPRCRWQVPGKIEDRFKGACIKRRSEHDQVPPGLQVSSSAPAGMAPGLRCAP